MKLLSIKIENYRNIGCLEFSFNDNLNFILGENNLGKSNFIDLLEVLFSFTRFSATDFFDIDKQIKIDFELKLSSFEKRIFYTDENILPITATQKNADSNIVYVNSNSGKEISVEGIRCVNFFRHTSSPGVGWPLKFSLFANSKKLQKYYEEEYGNLETLPTPQKILLQIEFIILEKISLVSKTRKEKIQDAFQKSFGNKNTSVELQKNFPLPILLAFDELEIHLHPYMQRSLVRALSKIINNENKFFCNILEKEFCIESLSGQLFIVTHSPNMLLNNYKQFIRFYRTNSSSAVVCGENINVKNDKHLFKNFIYFKEAFFAKFVIVVEGDSEFGAIPEFAEKILNGNGFDNYGVSVIKADGKTSVNLVMNILKAFKINNLGMVDRDDDDFSVIQARLKKPPYLYTTYFRDFEEELLEKLGFENYSILDRFLFSSKNDKYSALIRLLRDEAFCKKKIDKYSLPLNASELAAKVKENPNFENYIANREVIKLFYLSELNRRKGISFWHELGYELSEKFIPDIYKKIILEAVKT